MPSNLSKKVVFVTGASSGIGEATAITLAENGARVALFARRKDRLEALEKKIKAKNGESIAIAGDITSESDITKAVDEIMKKWGQLDVLVNNAGVMLLGPIAGADTTEWKKMVDVNLMGLMYATHKVLPIMNEQKSGHIVNISSVAGRVARTGAGVYNATKFAVGAFSESLRQEVSGNNIRVTIIEPGAVLTELTDHITHKETKEKLVTWVKGMEALTSEDIADSILYAVSQHPRVNVNEILIRPTQQVL